MVNTKTLYMAMFFLSVIGIISVMGIPGIQNIDGEENPLLKIQGNITIDNPVNGEKYVLGNYDFRESHDGILIVGVDVFYSDVMPEAWWNTSGKPITSIRLYSPVINGSYEIDVPFVEDNYYQVFYSIFFEATLPNKAIIWTKAGFGTVCEKPQSVDVKGTDFFLSCF